MLYTDGVTEAFNVQGIMYGEDRLKDVLRSTMDQPATTVIETLQSDLVEFRGDAPLSDDTTILAIARNPQAQK